MLQQLNNYDWHQAFLYANKPAQSQFSEPVSLEGFTCEDVKNIIAMSEGVETVLREWIITGQLKDGRFFYLEARGLWRGGVLQTGHAWVSSDFVKLIQFGMGAMARRRFGYEFVVPRKRKENV